MGHGMGEEFCSIVRRYVCSSVLEFSKGVLEQVFEEFEKALITRAFARLRFEVRATNSIACRVKSYSNTVS